METTERLGFDPKELIDPAGYANFKGIASELRHDWDWANVIVGGERTGKSVLGHIICAIVDPNYALSRVVFPTPELSYACSKAKPYSAINQDEGAETWLSADVHSKDAREMTRLFMMVGYKNLFFNINIPDVRLIQRYLKTFRTKSLIRITRRGCYAYYSKNRIREIRIDSNNQSVKWPVANFRGTFKSIPKASQFWVAYLAKKAEHIGSKGTYNPKVIAEQLKMERALKNTVDLKEAAKIMGMNSRTLSAWIRDGSLKKVYHVEAFRNLKGWRLRFCDAVHMAKHIYGDKGGDKKIERMGEEDE